MRVLFSAGAGFSHVTPLLPLASAVRDAGHELLFVTGADAVRYAGDLPTAVVGGGRSDGFAEYLARFPRAELARLSPEERLAHLVTHVLVEMSAAARLPEMRAVVEGSRPDVVVAGAGEFAAVLAAELAGVPYVVHAIGPPKTASVMAGGWRMAGAIVRQHGGGGLRDRAEVPYADLWPLDLRPAGAAWDHPTRWPLRPENAVPRNGSRPSIVDGMPHARTVYVTGGTSHHGRDAVLGTVVSALRDEPVNVVVTVGSDGNPDGFADLPDSVRVTRFVPQDALLPHVDLVVCHAGAGTVLGALAHGVPLVLWPLATDQFDAAAQVAAAGAGITLGPAESTEDGVRSAVRTVLATTSHRTAAEQLADRIGAMPTPADVAAQLTAFAAGARMP